MRIVIVGAGFAGACAAWLLRGELNADITILEQGAAPGGMLRTMHTAEGLPYEYGPRIVSVFRGTPDVLPFLRGFLELQERRICQGTRLRPEYPAIPFPVDRGSLRALPCGDRIESELAEVRKRGAPPGERDLRDYLETSVGPTLTELAFEGFNRKFWGRRLEQMPAAWGKLRRLERVAEKGQYRLPSAAPHYYPDGGFNPLFEKLLAGFVVRHGVNVTAVTAGSRGATVATDAGEFPADLVIATAPIDAILGYRFGALEWRGYRVTVDVVDPPEQVALGTAPDGTPFSWLYTPWPETPVCRTTDVSVIHHGPGEAGGGGPKVVLREIAGDGMRMYPVWWEDARFSRYLAAAAEIRSVAPLGRLGLYKYTTMDSTYSMVRRFVDRLDDYLRGDAATRFEILREVRGDWAN